MFDFAQARSAMLESQIRTNDVTDLRIQAAFRAVPRECFVPKAKMALSYSDQHIDLGQGRFMLRPRDFAKMLETADIAETDIVLSIGCGRGYCTAIMCQLAETVIAIEETDEIVAKATALLDRCDTTNAAVIKGDFRVGAPEHGPFDVIFVSGAVSCVPKSWTDQLTDGGRLVVCVMGEAIGQVKVYHKSADAIGERTVFDATLPYLPGFENKAEFVF